VQEAALTVAARQAAALFVASGLLTLVNNFAPDSQHLDLRTLTVVGVLSVVIGVVSWFLPWARWPARASLAHVPFALALIGGASALGGVSPFTHSIYFVVLFVWVGLAQPPRTSWWLALPAAATYVGALLIRDEVPPGGVSSVTVAIPTCVLVGEIIARSARRRALAQAEAQIRAELSERLLDAVADVTAELDPEAALRKICDGVRGVLGAAGAAYVAASGSWASVRAVSGLSATLVDQPIPLAESSAGVIVRTGEPVVVSDFARYPHLMDEVRRDTPGLHQLVAVPCQRGGQVVGALYAALGRERAPVTAAELAALQVLAAHVAGALRNADDHSALLRQRAREQAVIDGMADGMAVVAPDGTVRSWNAAAAALTGIEQTAALGRPLPFAVDGDIVVNHRTPDGRWLEVVSSPLADGEMVVGIRDVSKAKALDEAKDLFLATTSHELRTPLTVVKGYTHTLQQRWDDLTPELRAEALSAIAHRTESLIGLVDRLLLSAGTSRHTLSVQPLALDPIVRDAAADVSRPGHPVTVSGTESAPTVLADATAVRQVLDQLLDNAVKYSPDGGAVEVVATADARRVVVAVRDRGVGLASGTDVSLFEPFTQGQSGDTRPFGGVGIGLHIVRTLIEAMGGGVSARPRAGGGAEMSFWLPRVPADPVPSPRDRNDPVPAREPRSVSGR
jgi:signal transduction histidine kinase